MNPIIPESHKVKILEAMQLKHSLDEKRGLSLGGKESILKLKDTTLGVYTDYNSLKSKVNMVTEFIEMFKE